jgi:hypothetical protein
MKDMPPEERILLQIIRKHLSKGEDYDYADAARGLSEYENKIGTNKAQSNKKANKNSMGTWQANLSKWESSRFNSLKKGVTQSKPRPDKFEILRDFLGKNSHWDLVRFFGVSDSYYASPPKNLDENITDNQSLAVNGYKCRRITCAVSFGINFIDISKTFTVECLADELEVLPNLDYYNLMGHLIFNWDDERFRLLRQDAVLPDKKTLNSLCDGLYQAYLEGFIGVIILGEPLRKHEVREICISYRCYHPYLAKDKFVITILNPTDSLRIEITPFKPKKNLTAKIYKYGGIANGLIPRNSPLPIVVPLDESLRYQKEIGASIANTQYEVNWSNGKG